MGDLTANQEAFALAYVETGNAAEAYRRAYDKDPNARDNWIYVEASQLLDHPKVSLRVEAIQAEAARLSMFTIAAAFREYEEARQLALSEANPSAAVSAVTGKVKLFGLEAPARSRHEHVGKDGGPIQTEDMSARDILTGRLNRITAARSADSDAGGSDGGAG